MFFLYISAAFMLIHFWGQMHKTVDSWLKLCTGRETELCICIVFYQIYNMILFYTSQSLWKQVYTHELHFHSQLSINRNAIKYSLAHRYSSCSATHSKMSMWGTPKEKKKGNLTDCVSSVRFSNSIRAVVIMHDHYERLWLFIAQVTRIHHMCL